MRLNNNEIPLDSLTGLQNQYTGYSYNLVGDASPISHGVQIPYSPYQCKIKWVRAFNYLVNLGPAAMFHGSHKI